MSVLHELYAIKIPDHRSDAKIILSVTKCVQKCLRNRTTNKKIQILRKNELNLRLLAKKSTLKMPCAGDLLTRTGEGEIGVLSGELTYV